MWSACPTEESQHPRPSHLDSQRWDPHLLAAPIRDPQGKKGRIPKIDKPKHQAQRGLKPNAFLLAIRATGPGERASNLAFRAQMFPRQGRVRASSPSREQKDQNKICFKKNRKEENPKLTQDVQTANLGSLYHVHLESPEHN